MVLLAASDVANFWSALPSILWVIVAVVGFFALRNSLKEVLEHLVTRVRAGAPMKFGAFELGAIRTEQHSAPSAISYSSAPPDLESDGPRPMEGQASADEMLLSMARDQFKEASGHLMLVHRLFLSAKPKQIYDALVYVVPTSNGSLARVTKVDYFLGPYWGNQIFTSSDRGRGFPLLTSAYGPFVCCARVVLNDGTTTTLFRYIDFEMGAYAPVLASESADKGSKEKQ